MKKTFVVFVVCLFSTVYAESVCGDWEQYNEEKCIKLFDKASTQSFADAEKTCAKNGSKLISIHLAEEQKFIENYLFKKKTAVDNVWLGARNDNTHFFHWEDSSNLTFSNWAPSNPKAHSTETCIQMHADDELKGKWSNEPCAKKNLVVCEKGQNWSLSAMQEFVAKMQKQVNQIKLNPVPIGFIYTQLPKQKSPQEIWPWMSWTEDSAQYDGVFFRVASGNAKTFGTVQEEFSPYIDEISFSQCSAKSGSCPYTTLVRASRSGWSGAILTADFNSGSLDAYYKYLNFHTDGGEVRPKNMAVKVWRRTA